MLFKLFTQVPESNTSDFYERARYALTWRLCLSFCIVIGAITVTMFVLDDPFKWHYFAVWCVTFFSIIEHYRSKAYKLTSKIIAFGASAVIISSIAMVPNAFHIMEMLWFLVIGLFTFFTLGRWWGFGFIILNASVYLIYFNTTFADNISNPENMSDIMPFIISIEYVFALILISYIMFQFYEVNNYAEKNRKLAFSELKKEKELVDKQNAEKTVLLQEIHHRVKNNLQVIISLLRIQSQELKSDEAKKTFNEAINRIMTMSLIHQKMYEKDSLSNIDLKDYVDSLVQEITKSYSSREIQIVTDIHLPNLGPKSIVSIALLLNELITNSIKHAFEERGKIRIAIGPDEKDNNYFYLHYADDGKWKEPQEEGSFGLQLIQVFTEQMDGTMERTIKDDGTYYKIHLNKLIGSN